MQQLQDCTPPARVRTRAKPFSARLQDTELRQAAQDSLARGRAQLSAAQYDEAVASFTDVLTLAPRRYTLSMQALLGRREAFEALGQRAEDSWRQSEGVAMGTRGAVARVVHHWSDPFSATR